MCEKSSYRMLWDLRLISFQQRFMSPVWCGPPPLSLRHSVPSSCPSPSTVDWHGTQWHPGHEGRPAAKHREATVSSAPVSITVHYGLTGIYTFIPPIQSNSLEHNVQMPLSLCEKHTTTIYFNKTTSLNYRGYHTETFIIQQGGPLAIQTHDSAQSLTISLFKNECCFYLRIIRTD